MILPDLEYEKSLWQKGYKNIIGIDEVGRGSWAGPLVAAGVIFSPNTKIPPGIADSKSLRHKERVKLSKIIKQIAQATIIVEIPVIRINKVNIQKSTYEAFRKVIRKVSIKPDYCLIDAFYIKHVSRKYQLAITNGDKISASIAAASIVAKVYRDKLMKKLHFKYPQYGFGKHKGYGTKMHANAIKLNGFCKIHRTCYKLNYLLQ